MRRDQLISLAGAVLLALGLSVTSRTLAQALGPDHYGTLIRQSAARVSAATGTAIDPRALEQIIADSRNFSGNFCGSVGSCTQSIENPRVLDAALAAVVADLAAQRPVVKALSQRLAETQGSSMDAAGWQTTMENVNGLVVLSSDASGSTVALQTSTGRILLGRNVRRILTVPGRATFALTSVGGTAWTSAVDVQIRRSVTISAPGAGALASTTAAPPTGDVEVPDCLCVTGPRQNYDGPYAVWNWGRGKLAEPDTTRRANLASFVSQRGIEIRVQAERPGLCAGYCLRTIGMSFVRAIAFWRSGCDRCSGNAFVTVRLGDRVWLDRRAANRLRQLGDGLALRDLDLSRSMPGESNRQLTFSGQFSPSTIRVAYQEIDEDTHLLDTLCALPAEAAPWTNAAKNLACPGGTRTTGGLRPILQLKVDQTSCGPARSFLACGAPGGNVELALADSRYRFPGPRGPYLLASAPGSFLYDGQAILIHEVAHWFGVPHAETARSSAVKDVMSEKYRHGGWCVSLESLAMLNNAADVRWSYRISGMAGLARPEEDQR